MNIKRYFIFLMMVIFMFTHCKEKEKPAEKTNTEETEFKDSRDGQVYKTVRIGSQIWMAENLNFITDSSWCYDNNPENCLKYGRLYNWDAAMIACPEGWHLPSSQEWQTLVDHIGGREVAGKKMKSTSGWSNEGNGSNDRAFNAFPAGYLIAGSGFGAGFRGVGDSANWWSSTESDPQESWALSLAYHSDWANLFSSGFKTNGLSCRCIKN
jgi:uncharacterized protein (TIGR02145 family)